MFETVVKATTTYCMYEFNMQSNVGAFMTVSNRCGITVWHRNSCHLPDTTLWQLCICIGRVEVTMLRAAYCPCPPKTCTQPLSSVQETRLWVVLTEAASARSELGCKRTDDVGLTLYSGTSLPSY